MAAARTVLRARVLPLAVLLVLVIAAVDYAIGPRLLLLDLLAIGPCLAAATARPREVVALGGLVVGLILAISPRDRIWGEAEQLYALAAAVLVTVISAFVAQQRQGAQSRANDLAAIVDSAQDAIITRRFDGTVIAWNRAAERLYGAPVESAEGRVFRSQPAAELAEVANRVRDGEGLVTFESVRVDRDGVRHPVHMTARPLRTADGDLAGYSAVTRDLSALREAEAQRDTLAARLQQADRLDALGQLAGGVAHDFNNLLGVILNYAELAAAEPEHAKDDLAAISDAAQRAAGLTRQLLAFSQSQAVPTEVVDVSATARAVGELLDRTLPANITLTVDAGSGPTPVVADQARVDQLVMNLAVNARDAMPDGGQLSIEVATRDIDAFMAANYPNLAAGRWVVVSVTDNGVGMSKEVLEHAFEPFFTTKPRGQGTGLGLATVYGIVRQLGGDATIYSEEGHGTTVRLYLPPTAESLPGPTARTGAHEEDGRGLRVLLVEDEPALQESIRRMLVAAGYVVQAVGSAEEAVAAVAPVADDPPDLLVTDVMLPGRSGVELARELQAAGIGGIVLMSGYAAPALGVEAADLTVLQKPFSKVDLFAALEAAVRG